MISDPFLDVIMNMLYMQWPASECRSVQSDTRQISRATRQDDITWWPSALLLPTMRVDVECWIPCCCQAWEEPPVRQLERNLPFGYLRGPVVGSGQREQNHSGGFGGRRLGLAG